MKKSEMDAISVYTTWPDRDAAEKAGHAMVTEGLAACANILEGVTSIYRWEGKIHKDAEVIVFFKTRAARFERLRERLTELHTYGVPCIVSFRIERGHGPYLDWLREMTS